MLKAYLFLMGLMLFGAGVGGLAAKAIPSCHWLGMLFVLCLGIASLIASHER
jgi:hypothetical protein